MAPMSTAVHSRFEQMTKRTLSKHRHASPSAPWPWVDIGDPVDSSTQGAKPSKCPHKIGECEGCWAGYPQSLFPNWTPAQVQRSGMSEYEQLGEVTTVHRVDVFREDGIFFNPGKRIVKKGEEEVFWKHMQQENRGENVHLRVLFVENLSRPVMKMLGTRYKVEPFFWTSSINWIPSRYQESVRPKQGDHITVTLSFPRAVKPDGNSGENRKSGELFEEIDTQASLPLKFFDQTDEPNYHLLVLDLISIHLIRGEKNTIISYSDSRVGTPARSLHSRVYLAGQSVYWRKIFEKSKDPTFVLLTILWFALYAWDQSLELLWEHISQLELDVLKTNDMQFTQELHRIRAYLLHYASLLDDFRKTVTFVSNTPNPAMDADDINNAERELSGTLLKTECHNLMTHIDRLQNSREMWDKRLTNVMQLAFSSVNIEDSRQMKFLTEAAVRDSAAMKQIAYLTMVFLPATFVATAFGMNVKEIAEGTRGTLGHYAAAAIPLTVATVWIIVALQGRWEKESGESMDFFHRVWWPYVFMRRRSKGAFERIEKLLQIQQRAERKRTSRGITIDGTDVTDGVVTQGLQVV